MNKDSKADVTTQTLLVLFLQIVIFSVIFFNIPVFRQTIAFLYFSFVPGYLLLILLNTSRLEKFETLTLALGLSLVLLMIIGLLMSELLSTLGFSKPLSLWPMLIAMSSLTLFLAAAIQLKSEATTIPPNRMSRSIMVFSILPILSIIGTIMANIYANSIPLLLFLLFIVALFALGIISNRFLYSSLGSFAVLMIALALLWHSSLISSNITTFGSDVPVEYYALKSTTNTEIWTPNNPFAQDIGYGRIHAMLSVTILPTFYTNLLDLNAIWTIKLLIPLIFSFVPVVMYNVWKKYIGVKYSFIATFLFMSQATFYTEMLALIRQMVAEVFFALLLFVSLDTKLDRRTRTTLFLFFSFGLIISHYALAEIFWLFSLFTLLFLFINRHQSDKITVGLFVLFSVLMFAWYVFTSNSSVFESFLYFGDYVYRQLGDFFNPASRGITVLRGLGIETPPSMWNMFGRVFAYIVEALIVVGFLSFIKRYKDRNFSYEYAGYTIISMAFLAALIVVPGLASTLNMTRFYHILLFFLAPLCVLGAEEISRIVNKQRNSLLIIILITVLSSYFLFQSGFVYEVTKSDSWSVSLSKNRMSPLRLYGELGYIDSSSAFGAQWISNNVDLNASIVYADVISASNVLRVYSSSLYYTLIDNLTTVTHNGVVYLGALNVESSKIYGLNTSWNYTEMAPLFYDLNVVYANGHSVVYENSG